MNKAKTEKINISYEKDYKNYMGNLEYNMQLLNKAIDRLGLREDIDNEIYKIKAEVGQMLNDVFINRM
jgi:hypothetical protein